MDLLPYEIWKLEIFPKVESVNRFAQVCRFFNLLCNPKECKSKKELKRAIVCNDVQSIRMSDDSVEKYAGPLVEYSCKIKNKEAALYFCDFSGHFPHCMFIYDDPSIIMYAYFTARDATRYRAIRIAEYAIPRFMNVKIDNLRKYVIENFHLVSFAAELFIYDDDFIKEMYTLKQDVMILLFKYGRKDMIIWMMEKGYSVEKYIGYAIEYGHIHLLELFKELDLEKCMEMSCNYNRLDTVEYFIQLGCIPTSRHLLTAIISGCFKVIKRLSYLMNDECLEKICDRGNTKIIDWVMERFDISKYHEYLNPYRYANIRCMCEPNLRNRLMLACVEEDLETVKELYPHYPISLYEIFTHKSYKLMEILYRGERFHETQIVSVEHAQFMLDRGMTPDTLLSYTLYNFCNGKVVKFLVEKGAKCNTPIAVSEYIKRILKGTQ